MIYITQWTSFLVLNKLILKAVKWGNTEKGVAYLHELAAMQLASIYSHSYNDVYCSGNMANCSPRSRRT